MGVDTWSAGVLTGIKGELSDNLATALLAIQTAGGDEVTAPAEFAVQDDLETVSALPFVAVKTAGDTEAEPLLPNSFRLSIPLEVWAIMTPEPGPLDVDNAARTYVRGITNVLCSADTVANVADLFWVTFGGSRIERVEGAGGHRWRRAAIVSATLHVATSRE